MGEELGAWIASQGYNMVYGGATGGLMTRVSEAFRREAMSGHSEGGGQLIGVIPERIIRAGRQAQHCDELLTVPNMAERKRLMRDIADCFICLPGSYGTLDEMFDVIASGTIGEHHKPMYILNHKDFYGDLKRQVQHMKDLVFLPREESYKPVFVDTLDELKQQLTTK